MTTKPGRTALVTGVTGQDGAYLSAFLLERGYAVHGLRRRSSSSNTGRVKHLQRQADGAAASFVLHDGDMADTNSLSNIVQKIRPDEVYNLAAQSDVAVSFQTPEYTADVDGLGALRLLEAVRSAGLEKTTRLYQASSSELYGWARETPQRETTPFYPRSPYAVAKLYAYWTMVNHREAYGMHASNGILFNHESPLRGETFVTRKITRAVAAIALGMQDTLRLGNLDARRDWGHARDYVRGMWLMLQQDAPGDYVLATGETASVREFVVQAFAQIDVALAWQGEGVLETGMCARTGRILVEVDPSYFRPSEVDALVGDAAKAREVLGWTPTTHWRELCAEMVQADLAALRLHRRGDHP